MVIGSRGKRFMYGRHLGRIITITCTVANDMIKQLPAGCPQTLGQISWPGATLQARGLFRLALLVPAIEVLCRAPGQGMVSMRQIVMTWLPVAVALCHVKKITQEIRLSMYAQQANSLPPLSK